MNGFVKKSEARRKAELEQILTAGNRKAAKRWLREESLIMADFAVNEFLPDLAADYRIPKDAVAALATIITELAEQLKATPVPAGQVPDIPLPMTCN